MTSITIPIQEEHLARLQELAARLNTTPEELAKAGIEEIVSRPEEEFRKAADYILKKNAELYRRLS